MYENIVRLFTRLVCVRTHAHTSIIYYLCANGDVFLFARIQCNVHANTRFGFSTGIFLIFFFVRRARLSKSQTTFAVRFRIDRIVGFFFFCGSRFTLSVFGTAYKRVEQRTDTSADSFQYNFFFFCS